MSHPAIHFDINALTKNKLFKTDAYINGAWVKGKSTFPVYNPATREEIAQIADLDQAATKTAIDAADLAFKTWKNTTAQERSDLLKKWYDLQLEYVDELAEIMTAEQGKPFTQAQGEIKYGAGYTEWYAEEAKRIYGDNMPSQTKDGRINVIKQPIGVVGAITPWNFPSAMITRKAAPALAAGCAVVIKPSEDTPLSALALAELAEMAGFPKGVINVVTTNDSASVGQELTSNNKVRKISFTGSTKVGALLMEQSASTVKKVSLELGGNGAFIVFNDADLEQAATDLATLKFRNAGQICTNANRVFVQEDVYEEFSKLVAEKAKAVKLGSGFDESTDMGPVINEKGLNKIQELVSDAQDKGATALAGGSLDQEGSLFFQPTIIVNANTEMRFFSEEIFGPVAPLYKFKTEEEVLELANNTEYGLANYFYTNDLGRSVRVAEELESGIVALNTINYGAPQAPFGGMKQSGIGREGGYYGIEEFLEVKYIFTGGL